MSRSTAKVSSKRQITLPAGLCREIHVEPGDHLEVFVHEGRITLMKKQAGAAQGVLRHLQGDAFIADEDSLLDALDPVP